MSTISNSKIALQSWLRPALTPVPANCDFERFRAELEHIDANIRASCVEQLALEFALENLGTDAPVHEQRRRARFARVALRSELLRHLLGQPSFRQFSVLLAGSDLLSDFCQMRFIDGVRWCSKSTLSRASKCFSEEQLRRLNQTLIEVSASQEHCCDVGLERSVEAGILFADSTCLEANIHYPVDWVLLKDVAHTLLQALSLIRTEGLLNRMEQAPEALATQMNRLCIEMTHSRRRADSRKSRKRVLRSMKHLLKRIGAHAQKHRDLLDGSYERTHWSKKQAQAIIDRIDEKLALLPKVIKQAHERIIGSRLVANKDKIISAHDPDIHTLVRGKSGKDVEFGNGLYLAESLDGFIMDYQLYREQPPSDARMLSESLERQQALQIEEPLRAVVCDRGFDTRAMREELRSLNILNMICPRDVHELKDRTKDKAFAIMQRRRGSTEARIAILKNNGGRVCRAKGYGNRAKAVAFGVLSHNLWWIALKIREPERIEQLRAAA